MVRLCMCECMNGWMHARTGRSYGKNTLVYCFFSLGRSCHDDECDMLLKVQHCVNIPAGSPATDCRCMDQKLLGTEVLLMT